VFYFYERPAVILLQTLFGFFFIFNMESLLTTCCELVVENWVRAAKEKFYSSIIVDLCVDQVQRNAHCYFLQ
jgi:hypothetical protein